MQMFTAKVLFCANGAAVLIDLAGSARRRRFAAKACARRRFSSYKDGGERFNGLHREAMGAAFLATC
jgi:hypothetical protein